LAGIGTEPFRMITELVKSNGGFEQATIIGTKLKVPVSQAVLANGVTGHIAEFDDGHRKAIAHPGAIAVPTSLAVAEHLDRTGKNLLTAIVVAYEILIRLGTAINPSHYRIWHSTGTCGVFAAAAATAVLLKLDQDKTHMALGIAGTMAAGLQETFGTYAKPLNVGHACSSGVQAALLGQAGFTGPEDILMGKKGFILATTLDYDLTPLEQINDHHFVSNSAFYKMYSSCGHTHSPLDAIFLIMKKHEIVLADIKEITVRTYQIAVELTGKLKNSNAGEAKFSLPYCMAVALVDKKVTLAEFTAEKLQNSQILRLARKVSVIEDPAATNLFPERQASVQIEMNDGQIIEQQVAAANDTPQYDMIAEKFMALAMLQVDYQTALQIKETVLNLETMDHLEPLLRCLV
jgi:2-methylcitrate dehydratase PrpD